MKEASIDLAFVPHRSRPDTLLANNSAQDVDSVLDSQGLVLRSFRSPDLPAVSMTLSSYGCAASPHAATPTAPRAGDGPHRVEYLRQGIREWYENGPLGLEHGFTIDRDPDCGDPGKLAFSLAVGGDLAPTLAGQNEKTRLELRDKKAPKSLPLYTYSDLFAIDADGKELPSRMVLEDRTVRLEVDAAGARYPVTVDPMWSLQQRLDGAAAGDDFGWSVAISGNTAVVGADFADPGGKSNAGSAYIYLRSGTTWTLQQQLDGAVAGDNFGQAVAIAGDRVVIGAYRADPGGKSDAGSVYIYLRTGTAWTLQQQLDGTAMGDRFGYAVGIFEDTTIIGAYQASPGGKSAAGSAYVYLRSGTTWTLQLQLDGTAPGDFFGFAVALFKDTAIIGGYGADPGGKSFAGSAYLYLRTGTAWTLQQQLDGAATNDFFGTAVAIFGDTAVVGAVQTDPGGKTDAGSAYIYLRSGTTWALQQRFDGAAADDNFGNTVAISSDTAVVGAPLASPGGKILAGSTYVYLRSGTMWTLQQQIDGALDEDVLGTSVGISGNTTIIGAFGASPGGRFGAGSAFLYVMIPGAANGTACATGASCISGSCVDGVCCDTACGGGSDTDCQACSAAKKTSGADGACGPAKSTVICRPADTATGPCDLEERCDGASTTCPVNRFATTGVCRTSAGVCDVAESCNGSGAACPPDTFATTGTCREATGVCDVAETCNGAEPNCPSDTLKAAGTICKQAGRNPICDPQDVCDGFRIHCPAKYAPASTACGTFRFCNGAGICR